MTEEIRSAQESAKAEIRSLERWYNTRRSQIMQELERINNVYYERSSEINTKWAQYITELCVGERVSVLTPTDESGIPRVDRPMTLSELATDYDDEDVGFDVIRGTQMSISELDLESVVDENADADADDDESVFSGNSGARNEHSNWQFFREISAGTSQDESNNQHPMHLTELEIYAGYDEAYSVESDDDYATYATRNVAIVSDDDEDTTED